MLLQHHRNKASLLLFMFALSAVLQGCAVRSLYIPVSQNTPLFDSCRELQGQGYLGLNHIELQVAMNISKHAAAAANINFGGGIAIYDAALGLYGYNRHARIRYELFGGYGYNSNIVFPATYTSIFTKETVNYEINSLYNKYYLQPALGYFGEIPFYKIHFSFSLSSRFSYLRFKRFLYLEIDVDHTTNPDEPVYLVNKIYQNKGLFLIEPCFTNKVGMGNIYGIIQIQAMIPSSDQIDLHDTKFSPGVLFSLGVGYRMRFKKK